MRSNKSLWRQLEEIRRQLPEHKESVNKALSSERRRELMLRLQPVLGQMQEGHKAELFDSLQKNFDKQPITSSAKRPLDILLSYLYRMNDMPIYLGAGFYEAYEDGALNLHDCEDCGCGIPVLGGHAYMRDGQIVQIPGKRITDNCPLCSGKVGYSAYFHKNGGGSVA